MSQSDFSIVFGANSKEIKGSGKYKLVELPKELLAIIESGTQQCISIRGRPDDDAVVCTADKTYGIRAEMP
ncbi:sister chromatid cohesion DCC1 [Pyrrhoderma noxium]|uniref:Sister chromatid cohesion DCC1 n=1 Tax=Pyrrhoderma noxium TaxID=2282107 RepID=A0A286UGR5_9AGAM|nr:sister chromatid cohesion DCC1 [Pyrrhoderma noxium]